VTGPQSPICSLGVQVPEIGAESHAARGPTAKRIDVGNGLQMTVREIAAHVGCTAQAIHHRMKKGVTGADLLLSAQPCVGKPESVHDVGDGRMWTVRQIADYTGMTKVGVSSRIHRGMTGRALLARSERKPR
jgi:ABC-type molybdenum transport system ATPase subunit/photorepair protein PhrA